MRHNLIDFLREFVTKKKKRPTFGSPNRDFEHWNDSWIRLSRDDSTRIE